MSEITGTPAEGAAAPSAPETPAAPASDPVLDRVNELAGNVGSLVEGFQTLQSRLPAPEPEQPADPWAALTGQPEEPEQYFDQFGNPVQLAQPQSPLDPEAYRNAVNHEVQQALAPMQQQFQQWQIQQADQRLGQMIPTLANTPENQANRQQAFQLVSQALQGYPSEIANRLAADPNFIATQWKAAEADRLAAGQAPASETVPTLESAGGANPGGAEASPLDQAFAGAPQHKALAKGFY